MSKTTRNNPQATLNAKLFVNFVNKKVVALNIPAFSKKYDQLTMIDGYEEVGEIKRDGRVFINPDYFDHEDKYGSSDNLETIST